MGLLLIGLSYLVSFPKWPIEQRRIFVYFETSFFILLVETDENLRLGKKNGHCIINKTKDTLVTEREWTL